MAITGEFYTQSNLKTKHVKLKSLRDGTNNNMVERLNVQRGIDHNKSAEKGIEAQRIFYNYIRPH